MLRYYPGTVAFASLCLAAFSSALNTTSPFFDLITEHLYASATYFFSINKISSAAVTLVHSAAALKITPKAISIFTTTPTPAPKSLSSSSLVVDIIKGWSISLPLELTLPVQQASINAQSAVFLSQMISALNVSVARVTLVSWQNDSLNASRLSFVILPDSTTDPTGYGLVQDFMAGMNTPYSILRTSILLSFAGAPPVDITSTPVYLSVCTSGSYAAFVNAEAASCSRTVEPIVSPQIFILGISTNVLAYVIGAMSVPLIVALIMLLRRYCQIRKSLPRPPSRLDNFTIFRTTQAPTGETVAHFYCTAEPAGNSSIPTTNQPQTPRNIQMINSKNNLFISPIYCESSICNPGHPDIDNTVNIIDEFDYTKSPGSSDPTSTSTAVYMGSQSFDIASSSLHPTETIPSQSLQSSDITSIRLIPQSLDVTSELPSGLETPSSNVTRTLSSPLVPDSINVTSFSLKPLEHATKSVLSQLDLHLSEPEPIQLGNFTLSPPTRSKTLLWVASTLEYAYTSRFCPTGP